MWIYSISKCIIMYADDNTASYSSDDINELVCQLESELINILKCFKTNCLCAKPWQITIYCSG